MIQILLFPNEILRKIICMLPINLFMMINKSCKHMYHMDLKKLLIPWGIEGICNKNETISSSIRQRYLHVDRKRGPLYCMYYLLSQIAIINGDFCKWDNYDTNQHDFIYLLLLASETPWYSITNPLRIKERSLLKLNSIPSAYHSKIMKRLNLRALL